MIRTPTCAYQGVENVKFFGKFCVRNKYMIPLANTGNGEEIDGNKSNLPLPTPG